MPSTLALHGGPKAKQTPFPPRKRHGSRDRQLLNEVIDQDILFYFLGTKVFEFQRAFARLYGKKHCIACSSGTASVHMTLGALALPAGSEVITTSITDMGSLTGVLYQGLVPVFADVEPGTLNMSPASVRSLITPRTSAILVVHHAGLAADMDEMLALGREFSIPVIEDCAQAYLCEYKGRICGSMGAIASFSLNHFKHIECGSGGMILTDDDALRYRATLFLDKCYQREEGIRNPFFLAPNYQMTELQGAVALAQLEQVESITARRNVLGTRLNEQLRDIPGVIPQTVAAGSRHTYFLYLFRLDFNRLACTAREFSQALAAEGVPNADHMITGGRPVYLYDIFQNRTAFPGTEYPFSPDRYYRRGDCPVAEQAFEEWITMNLYEHYSELDIDEIAAAIGKVAAWYSNRVTAAVPAFSMEGQA
ncbi:MAG: DegT/DnrJ/EryC1/StrS family aminotransferase [Acidobacteria bacterium]|nr:DegT/DnrJ/EryC1/StrS family aminotransferase [Acidobacteriota bacterium]